MPQQREDGQIEMSPEDQRLVMANLGLAGAVVAKHVAGRRDNEDLMAEATLGMCKATIRFDKSRSKFSTYGTYGAFYGVSYYVKRQNKHRRLLLNCDAPADCGIEAAPDPANDDEAMAEASIRSERLDMIRQAMRDLSPREIDILESRLNGQTLDAVGRRLGITKERVRQLECQARKRIRTTIDQKATVAR